MTEERIKELEEENQVIRNAWEGAWKMIELWRDRHADEHDRATRAELALERVRKVANRWKEYAEWSMAGGEGTGGPHRPTIHWDVAADDIYDALENRGRFADAGIACLHNSSQMDRTLCACGAMHFYCEDCNERTDECRYDKPKPTLCSACFNLPEDHSGHPNCCWECGEQPMDEHEHKLQQEGTVDLNTVSQWLETGEYTCECGATATMTSTERLRLAHALNDAQRGKPKPLKVEEPRYDVGSPTTVARDVPSHLVNVVWTARPRWWQFWRWGEDYAENWRQRIEPAALEPDCQCGSEYNCAKHETPYY